MKILPVLITGGLLVLVVVSAVMNRQQLLSNGVIPVAFLLLAFGSSIWLSYRLKFVAVDNEYLYVLGWSKHIAIPFSNIETIEYSEWARFVTVQLKSAAKFGKTIHFMPTVPATMRSMLNSASVVEDLRHRMEQTSRPADAI